MKISVLFNWGIFTLELYISPNCLHENINNNSVKKGLLLFCKNWTDGNTYIVIAERLMALSPIRCGNFLAALQYW